MIIVRIIIFLLGLGISLGTLFSAVRTTVLPGRKHVWLTRILFRSAFCLFRFVARRLHREGSRRAILAMYAPIATMLLPLTWSLLLIVGASSMFWAIGVSSIEKAIALSGAALTTQGFLAPQGIVQTLLYIGMGIIGLGIVSLLISFLPTIYAVYSQREREVTQLAQRFGTPPSGTRVLEQIYRLSLDHELEQFWHTWEEWFTTMNETHLSTMEVLFYRSSRPDTSWMTTAGAILDACSLFASAVDQPDDPWLGLCFQAGCRTLRDIATNLDPSWRGASATGMHVTRAEYAAACQQLGKVGVPLKSDQEESWLVFAHMRYQYDAALFTIGELISAPSSTWPSEGEVEDYM